MSFKRQVVSDIVDMYHDKIADAECKYTRGGEIDAGLLRWIQVGFDPAIDREEIAAYFDTRLVGFNPALAQLSAIRPRGSQGLLFMSDGFYYKDRNLGGVYVRYSDIDRVHPAPKSLSPLVTGLVVTVHSQTLRTVTIRSGFQIEKTKELLEKLQEVDRAHGKTMSKTTGKIGLLRNPLPYC
ncbi:MAG: hypothetical protein SOH60_02735 [Lachnospiraceae bacterium]|jgi:hypothetical protein